MGRWNDRQTNTFVKLYLSERCLWDTSDKFYKSRFKKKEAYCNMIPKFYELTNIHIDQTTLMSKIRNLKSTYLQEMKKIRARKGYKPKLSWFDEWHSCFASQYRQKDNTVRLSDTEEETSDWLENCDNGEESPEEKMTESPLHEEEYNLSSLKQESPIILDVSDNSSRNNQTMLIQESKPGSKSKEDEFDIYAKFIASQMRLLDKERALRLQMQIHSLVNEARLRSLRE